MTKSQCEIIESAIALLEKTLDKSYPAEDADKMVSVAIEMIKKI